MAASLPSGWAVESLHLDDLGVATAKTQLLAAMNRGTALVTFTGHLGPSSWTFSNLFTTTDAAVLGATTLIDSDSEALLGEFLMPRLAVPGMPVGQEAKRELAQTHPELVDVLLGWSLMGDPALVIEP